MEEHIQQQYGCLLVSLENKEMPTRLELHEGTKMITEFKFLGKLLILWPSK